MSVFYRISMPHATFGVQVNSAGRVIAAAPIARWTIDKPWLSVRPYYLRRGADIEIVAELEGEAVK